MKQKALAFMRHPLVSGSSILFLGSLFANFLNFLFNIFMTRNLSITDYGTITSLISIIMMPALVSSSVIPTVVNFGAVYFARNDLAMVRGIFFKITKPLFIAGLVLLATFILFREQIGAFFRITDTSLIVLSGMTICITFSGAAAGALLQAKLAFRFISGLGILASVVKITIGVALVLLGLKAFGVMFTIFLAFTIPFIVSFYPLRFLFDKNIKSPKIETKELFKYGLPAAITSFSLTSLITTDIILVKHFFSPETAGLYAVLSLIGRVIFFLTAPIAQVMFPLIVQKYTINEDYKSILFMALLLVLLPGIGITGFYFLFPDIAIQFFNKQEQALMMAPYLGYFGFMIALYTLCAVLTNFFLSIKRTNVAYPLALASILQVGGIWIFHETFTQVISITFTIISLLLVVLLVYYFQLNRGKE